MTREQWRSQTFWASNSQCRQYFREQGCSAVAAGSYYCHISTKNGAVITAGMVRFCGCNNLFLQDLTMWHFHTKSRISCKLVIVHFFIIFLQNDQQNMKMEKNVVTDFFFFKIWNRWKFNCNCWKIPAATRSHQPFTGRVCVVPVQNIWVTFTLLSILY